MLWYLIGPSVSTTPLRITRPSVYFRRSAQTSGTGLPVNCCMLGMIDSQTSISACSALFSKSIWRAEFPEDSVRSLVLLLCGFGFSHSFLSAFAPFNLWRLIIRPMILLSQLMIHFTNLPMDRRTNPKDISSAPVRSSLLVSIPRTSKSLAIALSHYLCHR